MKKNILVIVVVAAVAIGVLLMYLLKMPVAQEPGTSAKITTEVAPLTKSVATPEKLEFQSPMLDEDAQKPAETKEVKSLDEAIETLENTPTEASSAQGAANAPAQETHTPESSARQTPTAKDLEGLKGKGVVLY